MDKFSELKAAAMAATPGPWILDDDSWSEGDNANVSTEERYDGRIVSIAQIEGGGSESGFDEPFSAEQQANARYITAANPAVVLALLAELEAKGKRITTVTEESEFWRERVDGAEKEREEFRRRFNLERSCLEDADKRIAELEAKLARFGDVRQHYLAGYDDGHSRGLNAGRLYKEDTGMVMHRHASANAYAAEGDE